MNKKVIFSIIFALIILSIIVATILLRENNNAEPISKYNNPIVPEGFHKVDTENAKWTENNGEIVDWNKGLVIEDELCNQFVWVPMDLANIHYDEEKIKYKYVYDIKNLDKTIEEENQILKYGGFYVARYEAGVPNELQDTLNNIDEDTNNISGIPVSKAGIRPWNYISYSNALKNAQNMYKDSTSVKSGLLTERQVQAIGYWISQAGYDVENAKEWGNYSNVNFSFTGLYSEDHGKTYQYGENKDKKIYNMILGTGITERNMANNIYDFVGNLQEYIFSNNYDAFGGYYDNVSFYTYGALLSSLTPNNQTGFRVVLYIE